MAFFQLTLISCISFQRTAPYLSIIKSIPFLALLILHYGNLWGLYFLITAAPKFLNTVLGFNLAHSGLLAALPYLARMTCGFIFGSIGDLIRQKNIISLTAIRKLFTILCKSDRKLKQVDAVVNHLTISVHSSCNSRTLPHWHVFR